MHGFWERLREMQFCGGISAEEYLSGRNAFCVCFISKVSNCLSVQEPEEAFPGHEWFAENFVPTDVQETRDRMNSVFPAGRINVMIVSSLCTVYALGGTDSVERIVIILA